MKTSCKTLMIILFSLCICCGCQSNHYTLTMYEQEPVKITLQDQKVDEFHQFINTIMDNSKTLDINKNDMPKSFSYIIKNNDKEEYTFISGYLLHDQNCYIVEDYQKVIHDLKTIFEVNES